MGVFGGWGRASMREERRGRRASMTSAEGGRESGEMRGWLRSVRRRVW